MLVPLQEVSGFGDNCRLSEKVALSNEWLSQHTKCVEHKRAGVHSRFARRHPTQSGLEWKHSSTGVGRKSSRAGQVCVACTVIR